MSESHLECITPSISWDLAANQKWEPERGMHLCFKCASVEEVWVKALSMENSFLSSLIFLFILIRLLFQFLWIRKTVTMCFRLSSKSPRLQMSQAHAASPKFSWDFFSKGTGQTTCHNTWLYRVTVLLHMPGEIHLRLIQKKTKHSCT